MGASPKLSTGEMEALFARAGEAGRKAFEDAKPVPMIVGTPKNMMASLLGGDDGGFDPNEPIYHVADGVCGFAWVNVRPGGSRFARWLIKNGHGKRDSYAGGVYLSLYGWCVPGMSQSLQRKEAAAHAVAEVLREAGIDAYSQSRID
jgi:hypothetical protein